MKFPKKKKGMLRNKKRENSEKIYNLLNRITPRQRENKGIIISNLKNYDNKRKLLK